MLENADNFASISNDYEPLKCEDIDINSAKNMDYTKQN